MNDLNARKTESSNGNSNSASIVRKKRLTAKWEFCRPLLYSSAARINYYDFIEIQSSKNRRTRFSISVVSLYNSQSSAPGVGASETIHNLHKLLLFHSIKKWFNLRFVDVFISLSLASPSSAKKYHKRIVNYSRVRKEQWKSAGNVELLWWKNYGPRMTESSGTIK